MRTTGLSLLLAASLLSLAPRATAAQETDRCFFCRAIVSADSGATRSCRTESDAVDVERKLYEPELTVSSYAGYALPLPRTHVFALLAAEPVNDWAWTLVSGVALTLFRGQ